MVYAGMYKTIQYVYGEILVYAEVLVYAEILVYADIGLC